MKIAVIAPTQIPARRANTIQVMKMTQALALLGHDVRLAAPQRRSAAASSQASWDEMARHYGLHHPFTIHWLPSSPSGRGYDFSLRAVRWAQGWADLIYTRLPQAAAFASILGLGTILETHDLPQGRMGPWLLRAFLKGRGALSLVVITQALADDLQQRFGISAPANQRNEPSDAFIRVLPDGVDLERYAGLPSPVEARRRLVEQPGLVTAGVLPTGGFVAGYTGHLYPGRGAALLLDLAARLPEVNFMIVGGEPQDVAALEESARSRQLTNVALVGFVPNADLPLYQAACDVLLMPYQRRVAASSGGDIAPYLSPMKLFEYLACGRPIVSSDLPVLQEVLNPQNAMLVGCDDLDGWVKAIRDLMAMPSLGARLAENSRRAAAQYTWEMRARRILAGFEK